MRRLAIAVLSGLAGYLVAAVASYLLVLQFSSNPRDRELEAAMTAAFFYGPLVAALAFGLGLALGGKARDKSR